MLPPSTGLSRETNDNFQELCNTFSDGILSRNPREVTLFGFPSTAFTRYFSVEQQNQTGGFFLNTVNMFAKEELVLDGFV